MDVNIILDKLPDKVEIGGKEYQIYSDFRTSILFETMMRSRLSDREKLTQMLRIYYAFCERLFCRKSFWFWI